MKLLVIIISLIFLSNTYSQGVTAGINPTTLPCGGGQVNLTALGNSQNPVFCDDFNSGGLQPGWATNVTPNFTNPCVAPVDGTTYLWMGNAAAAPRAINTPPVDVSCGGQICFDYITIPQGGWGNCEGQDLYNEGVGIQYSTNNGGSWTTFGYFAPNGDVLGNVPTTAWPGANGATPFTTWGNYCFNIPAAAWGPNTIFRIRQFNSSGTCCDHWGIDNFCVYATPCAPFYYDWDHIPGSPDPANVTANVTQTTTFTVHYTNGTLDYTDQVTVVVNNLPNATVTTTDETCLGDNDGTVIIDNPGGNGPYTINLTGPINNTYNEGNGSPDFLSVTNLPPGLYSYTTTSNTGCTINGTFTINPGPPCCSVTATGINPSCFNGSDGTATANPANGQAPYTYAWSNGQSTQTATGLAAGSYSVTITDANGCQSTASVTLNNPTQVTATTTPTNVSCFGGTDGQITVNGASGGTGSGYMYSLNGGTFQSSNTFTGLSAGNYVITVQDGNNCPITLNQTLTEPTDLTLTETNNVPETCGQGNGSVTVAASGGNNSSYTYNLGGTSNTTGNFTGLSAGTYTITVTDANSCTETLNVTIGNSAGPVPFVDASTDVVCAGGFNGSVTIGVTGGVTPLQFSLNSGPNQASNTFTLPAGNHTVTVTDANGCIGSVNFTINEPTPLTYTTTITPTLCNASCDGQITVNASGSNGGYLYSSDGGLTFSGSNVLTNLCAGNINVVVQDAQGCLANSTEVMTQPTPVTSTFTFVQPSCYGVCDAEIHMTSTTGGNGIYTYSIDNGSTFQSSPDFFGLCAGSYDIIVQDGNLCQATYSGSVVTTPPQITFTTNYNNPSNCGAADGSFSMSASNGTPDYDYTLHNLDYTYTAGPQTNNGAFFGLTSGLYTIVVTDANGCQDSSFIALSDQQMGSSIVALQDVTCYNGSDGLMVAQVDFGGVPPINFTVSAFNAGTTTPSQSNGVFGNLPADDYALTVTSNNGYCVNTLLFTITEPDSINFNVAVTDVTCPSNANNLVNNGTITVSNVTGGALSSSTYEYSIDGGATYQASPTFTNLAPGTYNVFVRNTAPELCEGQTTVTVNQPNDFNVTVNATNLTCYQDNTGFMQIVATGATSTPGYTFNVNGTSNNTGIYPNLPANPGYFITVTDGVGCTFQTTQAITEPAQLTATYVATDANCFDVCDGQINVTANGGTVTSTYLYSSDAGTTYQSSNLLTGLCDGTYTVRVKDDNNCSVDGTVVINEPTQITFTTTSTPATCGNNNATVTITAQGGTTTGIGYQYAASIDNGVTYTPFQTTNTITNLPPNNNVIIKVIDDNGCEATETVNLSADPLPSIDFVQTTDPLCNGDNNGIIEITASGGVGTYQYSIDNGVTFQNTNVFNGLIANTYDVVVMDANMCQDNTQSTLTDPAVLQISSITPTDLLCNGDYTGEISITAQGGTVPYLYSIDGGVTTQGNGVFSYIAAGNYNIVVTDDHNCSITGNTVVNEPAPLAWNPFLIKDPKCFGQCDGIVTATLQGGTAPYMYNWSSAIATSSDNVATNVCSGTYSVIVTDNNGCQIDSLNFILTDPAPVSITSILAQDVSCNSFNIGSNPSLNSDGSVTVNVPTQTPPINQFSIDGGNTFQASNVFNGLSPGSYTVTVQNDSLCSVSFNTTIEQPDSLLGGVPPNTQVCFGEDVQINPLLTTGGTPPYQYTWTDDFGIHNTEIYNQIITSTTTFNLEISDNNNCYAGVFTYQIIPTPQLSVSVTPDSISICPGESVNLNATANGGQLIDFGLNGFDYSYSWLPASNSDTLNTLNATPTQDSTAYIINVTDACNAIASDTAYVYLYANPTPNLVGGGVGCMPYTATLVNYGNVVQNGGSVTWSLGDGTTITNQDSINYIYNTDGCYDISISVTTINGCTSDSTYSDLICVNPNPIAHFDFLPAQPTTSNQVVEFHNLSEGETSYLWTFANEGNSSEENPTFEFNATVETTYEVCLEVTSNQGCTDTTCQEITIFEELVFYVPNVFTPDHDDYNETFKPVFTSGYDPFDYHLMIFNRWGEVVFESYNAEIGWNGKYVDGLCEDGVYVWQISFGERISDKKHNIRGHVTLLK